MNTMTKIHKQDRRDPPQGTLNVLLFYIYIYIYIYVTEKMHFEMPKKHLTSSLLTASTEHIPSDAGHI
jgi:hypothetical protein